MDKRVVLQALGAASALLGKAKFECTGEGSFQLSGGIQLVQKVYQDLKNEVEAEDKGDE